MPPTKNPLHKRRGMLRLTINATPSQQRLVLDFPAVRAHLETERRLIAVLGILALMKHGLSLNRAARALNRCPSWASTKVRDYTNSGVSALAPKPPHGRPPRRIRPSAGSKTIALPLEMPAK